MTRPIFGRLATAAPAIVEAGRPGLGAIEVRTRHLAEHALIAITDNGCGMTS